MDFPVLADYRVKLKESEKGVKYLDPARELKKTMENINDGDTNCNWCAWCNHQIIGTGTGGVGNERMSRNHPNHSIVEISQNTEKSPGDLRRLDITQTPVKNHQLISKVKLATIVEGDPKAPFSIATTPRCRGGRYSIPWIAPLYP